MPKNRIAWIDTARGLCIFLVVLGHTILPYSWLVFIFSFHMPFFFFLSGYLYNPEKYQSWWLFLKKKAATLLWPYLVFFLINFIYWIFYFNSKQYFEPIWQMLYSAKLSAPFIPLWFLTCLFMLEIYFHILQKYLKKFWLFLAVLASLFLGIYLERRGLRLFWNLDIALFAIIYYYLGFMVKSYKDDFKMVSKTWIAPIGLALILIDFFLARWQGLQISMYYRIYGVEWIFILTGICGTLGFLVLARILKQTIFTKTNLWEFLGQNSLIILCLHTVFYYYVSDFFHYVLNIFPKISLLFAFVETIITLIILVPIIYLINNYLPILVGKFKKET